MRRAGWAAVSSCDYSRFIQLLNRGSSITATSWQSCLSFYVAQPHCSQHSHLLHPHWSGASGRVMAARLVARRARRPHRNSGRRRNFLPEIPAHARPRRARLRVGSIRGDYSRSGSVCLHPEKHGTGHALPAGRLNCRRRCGRRWPPRKPPMGLATRIATAAGVVGADGGAALGFVVVAVGGRHGGRGRAGLGGVVLQAASCGGSGCFCGGGYGVAGQLRFV